MRKAAVGFLVFVAFGSLALAQCRVERDLIHVTGTGELQVVPDEVNFVIRVENFSKDAAGARAENTGRLNAVVNVLQASGVDPKDYQVSSVSVSPRYKKGEDSQSLLGYAAEASVAARLRKLERLSDLNTKVLAAGASAFYLGEYSSSKRDQHRKEARALAVKAAQEKAESLTTQLGRRLGKAVFISTDNAEEAYRNRTSNAVAFVAGGGSGGSGEMVLATGVISVTETVVISFALE